MEAVRLPLVELQGKCTALGSTSERLGTATDNQAVRRAVRRDMDRAQALHKEVAEKVRVLQRGMRGGGAGGLDLADYRALVDNVSQTSRVYQSMFMC